MKQPQPSASPTPHPIPDSAVEAFRAGYAAHGSRMEYAQEIMREMSYADYQTTLSAPCSARRIVSLMPSHLIVGIIDHCLGCFSNSSWHVVNICTCPFTKLEAEVLNANSKFCEPTDFTKYPPHLIWNGSASGRRFTFTRLQHADAINQRIGDRLWDNSDVWNQLHWLVRTHLVEQLANLFINPMVKKVVLTLGDLPNNKKIELVQRQTTRHDFAHIFSLLREFCSGTEHGHYSNPKRNKPGECGRDSTPVQHTRRAQRRTRIKPVKFRHPNPPKDLCRILPCGAISR